MLATPEVSAATFHRLVQEHHARLYRFILKHVGNPEDAKDLTQQAFLEAHRGWANFRGESSASTWLYGIALNLTRNFRRSPRQRHPTVSDEVLELEPAPGDDPETLAGRRQMLAHARRILDRMSVDSREVFVLVVMDGKSYEEAAALLDIPVGTVRSRLSRARAAVRAELPGTNSSAK